MNLPKETLESLKCCQCDGYLSIFPIYACEKGNHFCGRCSPQSTDVRRQTAYEKLAKLVKFPCKNQQFGCTKSSTPENLKIHESECRCGKWDCFEKCGSNLRLMDFSDHYSSIHLHLMIQPGAFFEISFAKNVDELRVLQAWQESVFLVRLTKLQTDLYASVFNLHADDSQFNYKCEITFLTSELAIAVKLVDLPIKSVSSVLNLDETSIFKIKEKDVKWCNVNFFNTKNSIYKTNDSIVKEFVCAPCSKYILPPIHNCKCLNDNIKCSNTEHSKCVKCDGSLTQNPALECIARNINYPCLKPQCDAVLKHNELDEHYIRCIYRIFKCFVPDCTFEGKFEQYSAHLRSDHPKLITLKNKVSLNDICNQDTTMVLDDGIFVVSFVCENEMLRFSIKCIGSRIRNWISYKSNVNTFMYELIVRNGTEQRLNCKTKTDVIIPVRIFETSDGNNENDAKHERDQKNETGKKDGSDKKNASDKNEKGDKKDGSDKKNASDKNDKGDKKDESDVKNESDQKDESGENVESNGKDEQENVGWSYTFRIIEEIN